MKLVNRHILKEIIGARAADTLINKAVRLGVKKVYRTIRLPNTQFNSGDRIITAVHYDIDDVLERMEKRIDKREHVINSDRRVRLWIKKVKDNLC